MLEEISMGADLQFLCGMIYTYIFSFLLIFHSTFPKTPIKGTAALLRF